MGNVINLFFDIAGDEDKKKCNRCGEVKGLDLFRKGQSWCKECEKEYLKEYRENNKKYHKEYKKEYYENNKEKIKEYNKEWNENNKEKKKKIDKEYRENNKDEIREYLNSTVKDILAYNYKEKLTIEEQPEVTNNTLTVICSHCKERFEPTIQQVKNRIASLYGNKQGESRLYCSDTCKNSCPIFRRQIYQTNHPSKPKHDRPLQNELRNLVLERDGYQCVKCGATDFLKCHHIEGLNQNPLESADVDNCVTFCENCHREAHQGKGCSTHDLKCNVA